MPELWAERMCTLKSGRYPFYPVSGKEIGRCRRGETNGQGFYMLSACFVVFLFPVIVYHVFLCLLGVFRCRYIRCYIPFLGSAYYLVAT